MKRYFFSLLILAIFLSLWNVDFFHRDQPFTALLIKFPEEVSEEIALQIRVKEVKRGWSDWETVTPDSDLDEHETSENVVTENPEVLFQTNESTDFKFQWLNERGQKVKWWKPEIEPFHYGKSKTIPSKLFSSVEIPDSFRIISRNDWGADENLLFETETPEITAENETTESNGETLEEAPKELTEEDPDIERIITKDNQDRIYRWPLQYAKDIKFIVIHHTASQKNLDHPEVAIQNIYFYHSVRKKWGDIGYHFLIDPKGNIYEGRFGGDKIIGGHAKPVNKVSIGIGVLGNYDEGEIPVPVMRSLLTITNFLSKKYGIDPDGSTIYKEKKYKNIQGHRDNTKTLCPGKFLYQKLFGIREIMEQPTESAHIHGDLLLIPPESEKTFQVEIKNLSNETWNSLTQLKLAEPISGFEDFSFVTSADSDLVASLRNFPVSPGEIGTFQGKAKSTIASNLLVFKTIVMTNEISRMEGAPIKLAFFVEGVDASYEVMLRHDPKNLLSPGEKTEGYIELKNTGNVVWKREGPNRIILSATRPRNRKSSFFGSNNLMALMTQEEVKPGEVGRFVFNVTAPHVSGTYEEYFTPLIEGVRYLEDKDLVLKFEVRGDTAIAPPSEPIRIKLSFEKSPKITSEDRLMLFDGKRVRRLYSKNTTVTIRQLKNGLLLVVGGKKTYRLKGPVRIKPHTDGVLKIANWEEGREFRGLLEIQKVDKRLTLINELPLEDYVQGVAEEPNDAPYEKIKAIAILARSYAQFYMTKAQKFPGKPYHLDDDPRNSQKYLGYSFEKRAPNVVKATKDTGGKVVTYQGVLVKPPYFSQSDGYTRSGEEVFGWKDTPYLVSVPDPDCAGRELRGHGVGLSGCGAEAKAKRGESVEAIIKYYYQGVEILGGK